MTWNYKQFASPSDPVHKSDLSDILGDYGCGKKFRYKKTEAADTKHERRWSEKVAVGNVVHNVSDRALSNEAACAAVLAGQSLGSIDRVVDEECANERGKFPDDVISDKERKASIAMLRALFESLPKYIKRVIAVEAAFVAKVGRYYIAGNIDLIFETHTGAIGMTDWKTKAQKPSLVVLNHGFESGFYSHAIEHGWFLKDTALTMTRLPDGSYEYRGPTSSAIASTRSEARRKAANAETEALAKIMEAGGAIPDHAYQIGRFPEEIWTVHLRDFVPYEKGGSKVVNRPEDCAVFGVSAGTKVAYEKGQIRGGGWMKTRRSAEDGKRLEHLLDQVVRMVRMGIFVSEVTDNCERCPFKGPCLTDGYELKGDEAKQAQQALRGLDDSDSGLKDFAA